MNYLVKKENINNFQKWCQAPKKKVIQYSENSMVIIGGLLRPPLFKFLLLNGIVF